MDNLKRESEYLTFEQNNFTNIVSRLLLKKIDLSTEFCIIVAKFLEKRNYFHHNNLTFGLDMQSEAITFTASERNLQNFGGHCFSLERVRSASVQSELLLRKWRQIVGVSLKQKSKIKTELSLCTFFYFTNKHV